MVNISESVEGRSCRVSGCEGVMERMEVQHRIVAGFDVVSTLAPPDESSAYYVCSVCNTRESDHL